MRCLDLSKVVAETYEETFQRCLSICRLYEEWCHAMAKVRREVALAAQRRTYNPRIIVVDSRALHIDEDGVVLFQLAKFFDYHWPLVRRVDGGIPRYLVLPPYYWYFGGCEYEVVDLESFLRTMRALRLYVRKMERNGVISKEEADDLVRRISDLIKRAERLGPIPSRMRALASIRRCI